MTAPDLQTMLDVVQVMHFTLQKDIKVAIHCHAGLGRTGLTIASYLLYAERLKPEPAILLVRLKRPGSVQTQKQVSFVNQFDLFLRKLRMVYPGVKNVGDRSISLIEPSTFATMMLNQARYLHGAEQRILQFVPKVSHELS